MASFEVEITVASGAVSATVTPAVVLEGGGGGGVTDHGDLTGLSGDDHTQYHTDARAATWGDARYEPLDSAYTKAESDTRYVNETDHTKAAHDALDIDADTLDGNDTAYFATAANLTAHIDDTSDAHDASAISFSPAGTVAATTVQAAVEEVASEAASASSYRYLVTLGSDESVTTTAFANVSGLSFAVVSGTTYRFEAFILFTTAAGGTGANFSVNGPASPTFLAYHAQFGAASSTAVSTSNRNAYNAGAAGSGADTGGNFAYIRGIVIPSASGTFYVSFATEVAASAVTAKAGSTLEWW
jgi:hypothetical protein